jgi:hypothetical protein
VERRDLYEDDLTEERLPSPAYRDDVAKTEVLDPDTLDNDEARPSALHHDEKNSDSNIAPDDDDEDDEDDEEEEDDE